MAESRRANRAELLQVIFWFVVALIALAPLAIFGDQYPAMIYVYLLGIAVWIGLAVVFLIRVGSRRIHDFDQSAWWLLLLLVPFANLAFLLALVLIPGNPRANKYGAPPVG